MSGNVSSLTNAFNSTNIYSDAWTICENQYAGTFLSPCNRVLGNYEWNSQDSFSGTNLLSSQVNAGWGGAGIGMQTLLLALTTASPAQAVSTTNQFQLSEPSYNGFLMWSTVAGYAGTDEDFAPVWPWLRPIGQAVELYNDAVQVNGTDGDYHACTGAPSGVICAAFYNSSTNAYQLALVNTNTSNTSFSVTFPGGTTVPKVGEAINYSSGMTDNNENSNSVTIGALSGGLSYSGQTATLTIPALAAVALLSGTTTTQAPSAEGAPSFVGRAVGGGAYNASVAVPADIQDGDTIIAAVYSWAGYASPNESGWNSIDGNHDNANDYAELFQRVWHTGDPTTFIFYNAAYEKAVLRVYSGATEVDQHACAPIDNSNSASISALTISEVETYVGFWLNDSATITLPSDLDNPFSDWLQWFSADGDKVESTGAIPAEQATASQGDWVACGVTLTPTE
jgi:hypothetical protein